MRNNKDLEVQLISSEDMFFSEQNTICPDASQYDLDKIIFDLNSQLEMLSSKADSLDYLVSIGSGILCGLLDIFWTGEFNLARGRDFASDGIESFVKKTAKILGCESDDIKKSVEFLEKKFPVPSDGNTPDFGGGLQHHLRDFSHHPTIVGLMFSLLTQFTSKSYGTNTYGVFTVVDVPDTSKVFIGDNPAQKIINGTIVWFFHLVSDMAGSKSTAALSGGTGIPGPILSMAKELSSLPVFKDMQFRGKSVHTLLSQLFNGTLFAKRDANGRIIKDTVVKFDLRGELGAIAELGRQAIPVIANESIVRTFYFIRRLALEIRENKIRTISQLRSIDWNKVKPVKSPTLDRMLTIATGVFTTLDIGDAIVSQKYFVAVNYVGVGRFAVALGNETVWALKRRNLECIKQMYENISRFTYGAMDQDIYERIQENMDINKLGLTEEQTEILYNIEYYKTLHDIYSTKLPFGGGKIIELKKEWLREWKKYMTNGYASFLQSENATLHWHDMESLLKLIKENKPSEIWFRLVLLEAMLFEPYYPLSLEKDKKGQEVPSKKYKDIHTRMAGYKENEGDRYLEETFSSEFYKEGYIKRLRKCYNKTSNELNEVVKSKITSLTLAAFVTVITVATVGAFAPSIPVILVGSNFVGLSGAALTSACLAYLGSGAIAAGGLGIAGGIMTIVGGGTVLGLGASAGAGEITRKIILKGKEDTIYQSAKLIVSIREIFLNDEHDLDYSNSVYGQYVDNISKIEKDLVDLKLKANTADSKEKKRLQSEIRRVEEAVKAMKIAMKLMKKFISSFETGLNK